VSQKDLRANYRIGTRKTVTRMPQRNKTARLKEGEEFSP
jgi:hypothetical protein